MSSDDLPQRVTRVEEKVQTHDDLLDRVTETLDRLVRFTVRHEESKKRIAQNEDRAEAALDEVSNLRSYIKSRWYVLATIVAGAIMLAELATNLLL